MAVFPAGGLHDHRGFTLIELLIVIGLLVAIAYISWGGYGATQQRAEDEIAAGELLRLADALRRFKADTGYYPGQGPFALAAPGTVETNVSPTRIDCVPLGGVLRSWALPAFDSDKDFWFAAPANLALLFEAPALCGNHPLAHLNRWNMETRRGWHGPYLDSAARSWVDHGTDFNASTLVFGAPDGTGSPLAGAKILDIPAFGAGPPQSPVGPAWGNCANPEASSGTCLLGWRSLRRTETGYAVVKHELPIHPRPFAIFGLANGDHPRVVYWGADGKYGGRNTTAPCRPNAATTEGQDDIVLCLEGS